MKHEQKSVVMDGDTAAAYISYAFTEVASIFPITPSSTIAEKVDAWARKEEKYMAKVQVSSILRALQILEIHWKSM